MADSVLLFNKMDVFTYRLPAFQAFSAAHSLSRELHHLATLSVTRTVHTDSNCTGRLTVAKRSVVVALSPCTTERPHDYRPCQAVKYLKMLQILLVEVI